MRRREIEEKERDREKGEKNAGKRMTWRVIVIVVLTYNRQLPFLKNLDKTFKISLIVSAKNPLKS